MCTLAQAAVRRAAVFAALGMWLTAQGCAAPKPVAHQGNDFLPHTAAPGGPVAYVLSAPETATLANPLAVALAEAGVLVHLTQPIDGKPPPAARGTAFLVALGALAADEACSYAGRVAIAPPEPVILVAACANQPLLLLRSYVPAALDPNARPIWELRFEGLSRFDLTADERHTLLEAVALWVRNRALDQ